MEQQEIKAYIKKLKKDLHTINVVAFYNTFAGVYNTELQKEKQDIEAAIRDCKSLLPVPLWRRLLEKVF